MRWILPLQSAASFFQFVSFGILFLGANEGLGAHVLPPPLSPPLLPRLRLLLLLLFVTRFRTLCLSDVLSLSLSLSLWNAAFLLFALNPKHPIRRKIQKKKLTERDARALASTRRTQQKRERDQRAVFYY